jgi:signal transduction histidine kinase
VKVNNVVRAVLSYGEMQIQGDEYRDRSLERHREVVRRLGLDDEQAFHLRDLLLGAKTYTPGQLESLGTGLPKVKQWFYTLIDEEDRLQRSVEKVSHEIQTRLQAVIANAENLSLEMGSLANEEARRRADQLLYAALALDTVVQNLGEYLEEYRFRRQPIIPLLLEARNLYEAEARRRGIEVHITLHSEAPILEISQHHLQLALNNLIHNSVKYSFRSGTGRARYIRIAGRSEGRHYRLSFENYGVGILPEEVEAGMIFEDGYQGRLTHGEYRTGSGKGLYFVKRVIERHHGRIQVESELMADQQDPEGQPHLNRFTIYLPYEQTKGETK